MRHANRVLAIGYEYVKHVQRFHIPSALAQFGFFIWDFFGAFVLVQREALLCIPSTTQDNVQPISQQHRNFNHLPLRR